MTSRMTVALSRGALLAAMVVTSMGARAQSIEVEGGSVQNSLSPLNLVRATVANEVAAANEDSSKHMFRDRKKTPQGSQTRIYVETREAMAGMTIAYNDQPLSPQQLQNEEGRLAGLVGNSEQLKRKQHEQKEEADRTLRIVKALPDALLFAYDGTEIGTTGIGGEGTRLVRLKFSPNPAFRPPSHVEDVLVGMAGVLLIDPVSRRIAEIDGTLFKEVSFGWGILGHLDKGGHFLVIQADVGEGCWEVSRMSLMFTGKILLFKSLAIKSDEVFSNFRRVPADTTFAQGVELLKAEQAKLAQGGGPETAKAE
jgi:hypothetical protein